MTFLQLPGIPQVRVPPITKTVIACCGYQAHLGRPVSWTCPGCLTVHDSHVPAPDAAG